MESGTGSRFTISESDRFKKTRTFRDYSLCCNFQGKGGRKIANIDWTLTWITVQAIFTAMMAIAIICTAFFAVKQLREVASSRHAEVLGRIHDILGNPEVVAARQIVKNLPQNFQIRTLNDQQRNAVELVTRSFDRVGFYLWCKLIPENLVFPEYPGALWHWQKLEHYVRHQRETEGYEARCFFEYMASRTKEYRRKHGLST